MKDLLLAQEFSLIQNYASARSKSTEL